ncbi:MAG TPA: KUP/HAK/KT family potassium transporter, partial [Pseudomonadales bacterium]|nr:KUP/HAK/KT family potassium transporter [Pseudomonadales bacterium]
MALLALTMRAEQRNPAIRKFLILVALIGASLFYGDGMITPAISVLSAVEGLDVVAPGLNAYVVPITLTVLVALFAVQKRGTASVGILFGPAMLVWFGTLAVLGVASIVKYPDVLDAINPYYAFEFFSNNKWIGFITLGSAVLAVTGGEALYADMGHFGRKPIRYAWFGMVLPALLLNYFGQGALLLHEPEAIHNPFFNLAPDWAALPLVILATVATIIASQAVISGVFSVTRQAIQLGFSPRMSVQHTSSHEMGQIYVPALNWMICAAVVLLVVGFGSSSKLASAYGIAVTLTMMCDTVLAFVVAYKLWHWKMHYCIVAAAFMLSIDFAYFSANAIKIFQGGWFPLAIGLVVFTLLSTWKIGRNLLSQRYREE